MPLVQILVHVIACLENADEIHGGGHGATVPVAASGRPSAAENRRYPFGAHFAKETPKI